VRNTGTAKVPTNVAYKFPTVELKTPKLGCPVDDGYPSVTDLGCGYKMTYRSGDNRYFTVRNGTVTVVKIIFLACLGLM